MLGLGKRRGPTHEDALQASRSIMERALTQIVFYGRSHEAAVVAEKALLESRAAYTAGVMRAVD